MDFFPKCRRHAAKKQKIDQLTVIIIIIIIYLMKQKGGRSYFVIWVSESHNLGSYFSSLQNDDTVHTLIPYATFKKKIYRS